jgi:hypothetical protein
MWKDDPHSRVDPQQIRKAVELVPAEALYFPAFSGALEDLIVGRPGVKAQEGHRVRGGELPFGDYPRERAQPRAGLGVVANLGRAWRLELGASWQGLVPFWTFLQYMSRSGLRQDRPSAPVFWPREPCAAP